MKSHTNVNHFVVFTKMWPTVYPYLGFLCFFFSMLACWSGSGLRSRSNPEVQLKPSALRHNVNSSET